MSMTLFTVVHYTGCQLKKDKDKDKINNFLMRIENFTSPTGKKNKSFWLVSVSLNREQVCPMRLKAGM